MLELKMPENENKIIEIKRLRFGDEQPVAIETAWLPFCLYDGMTRDMIEGKSLYSIFHEGP